MRCFGLRLHSRSWASPNWNPSQPHSGPRAGSSRGVSYVSTGIIADAVAVIYLLRDPDFNQEDTITAGDLTGEIRTIDLRKTRFAVDGDTVVRCNAEIEKRWTKRET
jgi:hypothetical protein